MKSLGYRVHAIEERPRLAERHHRRFEHVLALDATDPEELAQAKPEMFRIAVVAIGSSVEASLLTAGNLVDAGVPSIWAKAVSDEHARILERTTRPAAHPVHVRASLQDHDTYIIDELHFPT